MARLLAHFHRFGAVCVAYVSVACAVLVTALIGGGYFLIARAGDFRNAPEKRLTLRIAEQLVGAASGEQLHAVRLFGGPDGLYGVVVQGSDAVSSTSIMWITSDGRGVVVGTLLDAKGTDLNRAALEELGLRFRPSDALRQASSARTQALLEGSKGPVLTVFIDPNCSYCHVLYQDVIPYVRKGKLRVRFVVVGVIKADSKDRAVAILSARNPLAALRQDQERFNMTAEEGGFPLNGAVRTASAALTVAANNALLTKSGISGTPALLYCSKGSVGVQLLIGMPQDLERLLGDLAQAPAPECAG